MNWRDILNGSHSIAEPFTHNSHNPQKYRNQGNFEDFGNIEDGKSASETVLQAFIDLVRSTAACDYHCLLHRDAIAAQLDKSDVVELIKSDRIGRLKWAKLLAYRLTCASMEQVRSKLQGCLTLEQRSSEPGE